MSDDDQVSQLIKAKESAIKSSEELEDLITTQAEKLIQVETELKKLLCERQNASRNECANLDAKINELIAQRGCITRTIQQMKANQEILQKQLLAIEKLLNDKGAN